MDSVVKFSAVASWRAAHARLELGQRTTVNQLMFGSRL
jgi:hypothetical protein